MAKGKLGTQRTGLCPWRSQAQKRRPYFLCQSKRQAGSLTTSAATYTHRALAAILRGSLEVLHTQLGSPYPEHLMQVLHLLGELFVLLKQLHLLHTKQLVALLHFDEALVVQQHLVLQRC